MTMVFAMFPEGRLLEAIAENLDPKPTVLSMTMEFATFLEDRLWEATTEGVDP